MYKSTVRNEQDRRRRAAVFGSESSSPERYFAEHHAIENQITQWKADRQQAEHRLSALNKLIGRTVQGKSKRRANLVQWTSLAQWKAERNGLVQKIETIRESIEKAIARQQTIEAERAAQIAKTHDAMQALYFMRVARQNLPPEVYERLQTAATGLCLAENEMHL